MSLHPLVSFPSVRPTFVLIFLLTASPTKLFCLFLILYLGINVLPLMIWQSTPHHAISPAPRLTSFYWSSFFILILPYALHGFAFLLQAWSRRIYALGNHIPARNAGMAFALECILLCVPFLKELHVRLKW